MNWCIVSFYCPGIYIKNLTKMSLFLLLVKKDVKKAEAVIWVKMSQIDHPLSSLQNSEGGPWNFKDLLQNFVCFKLNLLGIIRSSWGRLPFSSPSSWYAGCLYVYSVERLEETSSLVLESEFPVKLFLTNREKVLHHVSPCWWREVRFKCVCQKLSFFSCPIKKEGTVLGILPRDFTDWPDFLLKNLILEHFPSLAVN